MILRLYEIYKSYESGKEANGRRQSKKRTTKTTREVAVIIIIRDIDWKIRKI